jgi:hypothetical protein
MNDTDVTLDQILTIGGLGCGPYGGGDVVRWSPNGQELLVAAAIGGKLGLWLITPAGSFPQRVTTAPIALPFLASPMQSWSPDGRQVAYLAEHAGATELWLWERASARQRPLTRLGNHICVPGQALAKILCAGRSISPSPLPDHALAGPSR